MRRKSLTGAPRLRAHAVRPADGPAVESATADAMGVSIAIQHPMPPPREPAPKIRVVPAQPVMFVQHVPWEAPHRIAAALAPHFPVRTVCPLDGQALLSPQSLAGAVFMGGPMGVGDAREMPGLLAELRWIESALEQQLPLLGVCLGSS